MKKTLSYTVKGEFAPLVEKIGDERTKNYIRDRVLDQISWYDAKASGNQRRYRLAMIVSIVLSALIPVFTLLLDLPFGFYIRIAITVLSSGITVISAVNALYKFRELWVQYRSNCEVLKSMLHRYFSRSGEFEGLEIAKANKMLADTCEEYFTREYQIWATKIAAAEKDPQSLTGE